MSNEKENDHNDSISPFLLQLFGKTNYAEIAWNLLIYKELTTKNLSKLTNKDISTISRSLKSMEEANLVRIARTEQERNFKRNFWELSEQVYFSKMKDFEKLVSEALNQGNLELLQAFIITVSEIISSVIGNKVNNIQKFPEHLNSEIFSFNLYDKNTGEQFQQDLRKLILEFSQKHQLNQLSFDQLRTDGYISFILLSKITPEEKPASN